MNNEHKDHKISLPNFDFERTSYISETDLEKDIDESDLPLEMQRLLAMEDKQILPHQEVTELVNLGTDDEKKKSQDWLIPRFICKKGNCGFPQRVCRHFCLVLSRHVGSEHKDSGTSVAYEARMQVGSVEAQKGKADRKSVV